jgi:hypothetical protein
MRQKRWLIPVCIFLILAIVVYVKRQAPERAVVAFGIYHAHIFTPPSMRDESAWHRLTESAQFYWDFPGFVMARKERLKRFNPSFKPLVREIVRRQAAGEPMQYSMNIYRQIRWLLNFTPDDNATRAETAELGHSLTLPQSEQHLATEQQPSDGKLGSGLHLLVLQALLFRRSCGRVPCAATLPVLVLGPHQLARKAHGRA